MRPTPNFPTVSLLPKYPILVVYPYAVPVLHLWLLLTPGTTCEWDRPARGITYHAWWVMTFMQMGVCVVLL